MRVPRLASIGSGGLHRHSAKKSPSGLSDVRGLNVEVNWGSRHGWVNHNNKCILRSTRAQ